MLISSKNSKTALSESIWDFLVFRQNFISETFDAWTTEDGFFFLNLIKKQQ
jgi:hypothetical protein